MISFLTFFVSLKRQQSKSRNGEYRQGRQAPAPGAKRSGINAHSRRELQETAYICNTLKILLSVLVPFTTHTIPEG